MPATLNSALLRTSAHRRQRALRRDQPDPITDRHVQRRREILAEQDAGRRSSAHRSSRVEAAADTIAVSMSVTVRSCAGIDALHRDERLAVAVARSSALPSTIGAAPITRGTLSSFATSACVSTMPPDFNT